MKIRFLIFTVILWSIVKLHSEERAPPIPLPTLSEMEVPSFLRLVQGNNHFAFHLYNKIRTQPGNIYFSPYSIATGLGMLYMGAKGETAQEFQSVFQYSTPLLLLIGDLNAFLQKPMPPNAQVLMSNGLWIDQSFTLLNSFRQSFLQNFRMEPNVINFKQNINQTIQTINQWTQKQSNGKIRSIIAGQTINQDMIMVLTTAADLSGEWHHLFDSNQTQRIPFQVAVQRSSLTQMMKATAMCQLFKDKSMDIIILPLKRESGGSEIAMAIFLSKGKMTISELENLFTWENWKEWKKKFQWQTTTYSIPRFRINRPLNLILPLKELGLKSLFDAHADFSGITNQKNLILNQALHQSSLNFNEAGFNISRISRRPNQEEIKNGETYEFIANRPFLFLIWDQRTDAILFLGRVSVP